MTAKHAENMAFSATFERVFLVAFGTTSPTFYAWDEYLHALNAQGPDGCIQIMITAGGLPTVPQNGQLRARFRGRTFATALLSERVLTRNLGAAMFAWLTPPIRVFGPSELHKAAADLQIPQSRVDYLARELRALQRLLEAGGRGPSGSGS
jgi:hypothetical protein